MSPDQRDDLQKLLDEFCWAYIMASRERDGLPAERLFWLLSVRDAIEQKLDQNTA